MESFPNAFRDEIFETVFENAYHCLVVVDQQGFITYINNSYCSFLNIKKQDALGRHITGVIENTRMHIVVETGQEEIASVQSIMGNHMIANRIPVRSNGKIIAAVGTVLYRDTAEWKKMNLHIQDLLLELEAYRKKNQTVHGITYTLHDLIGASEKMIHVKETIKRIAPTDASILIRGESGTGKELVAHSIHHLSERSDKPFIKVNCAAIPEALLESELFGYKEGAFTGSKKGGKLGKFQLANHGTIFLDEIGDMPISAQVKLLRVLQEGELEILGSEQTEKIDVRIIAATNQPLEKRISEQLFREDLFYRINVVQLTIPALRERKIDIEVIAQYTLLRLVQRTHKVMNGFAKDVLASFNIYSWPGNIRELENVIESALYLSQSHQIEMCDLPERFQSVRQQEQDSSGSLKDQLELAEQQIILKALKEANGDKQQVRKQLSVSQSSLYEKIKKYKIND